MLSTDSIPSNQEIEAECTSNPAAIPPNNNEISNLQQQLLQKHIQLLELKKKKLDLELLETKLQLQKPLKNSAAPATVSESAQVEIPHFSHQQYDNNSNSTEVRLSSKIVLSNSYNQIVVNNTVIPESNIESRSNNNKENTPSSVINPEKTKMCQKSIQSERKRNDRQQQNGQFSKSQLSPRSVSQREALHPNKVSASFAMNVDSRQLSGSISQKRPSREAADHWRDKKIKMQPYHLSNLIKTRSNRESKLDLSSKRNTEWLSPPSANDSMHRVMSSSRRDGRNYEDARRCQWENPSTSTYPRPTSRPWSQKNSWGVDSVVDSVTRSNMESKLDLSSKRNTQSLSPPSANDSMHRVMSSSRRDGLNYEDARRCQWKNPSTSTYPRPTNRPWAQKNSWGVDSVEDSVNQHKASYPKPAPLPTAPVNITQLYQRLVDTGILPNKPLFQTGILPNKPLFQNMQPVVFSRPESLKVRQNKLYEILYTGMQCSNCGLRFLPEQSAQYSQHLDWHFRQNTKAKKHRRVAARRTWYCSKSDWMKYEQIENLEDRKNNYFEQQRAASKNGDEKVVIPSVSADPGVQNAKCELCHDKFDEFFNDDEDNWHLKNAIRVEDKCFHPLCYEDYKLSLTRQVFIESREEIQDHNIPGLEMILDDDTDDEKKAVKTEVLIAESDQSKPSEEDVVVKKEAVTDNNDEDDDDVIMIEEVPEIVEIDDDKEYFSEPIVTKHTVKVERIDDGFMDVEEGLNQIKNGGQIQIKSEPLDPDEMQAMLTSQVMEEPLPPMNTAHGVLTCSSDGNTTPFPITSSSRSTPRDRIKINISNRCRSILDKVKNVNSAIELCD